METEITLYNKAINHFNQLQIEESEFLLNKILSINAKNIDARIILGVIYAIKNELIKAIEQFQIILNYDEVNVLSLYNLSKAYTDLFDYENAYLYIKKLLYLDNSKAEYWFSCGVISHKLDKKKESIYAYDKALIINNNYIEAFINKGVVLNELKMHIEALKCINRAIEINVNNAQAWANKGVTQFELKNYEESIFCYDKALNIYPDYFEVLTNKAILHSKLNNISSALECINKAISINPNYEVGLSIKGSILIQNHQFMSAMEFIDRALLLNDKYCEAWINKGICYTELNQYKEALVSFIRAKKLDSNKTFINGYILHNKLKLCEWDGIEHYSLQIKENIKNGICDINPFSILLINDEPLIIQKIAQFWQYQKYNFENISIDIRYKIQNKINIGYLSSDFNNHATSHLISELFELHDKETFKTFGFSIGPNINDRHRLRIVEALDEFHDISQLTDKEAAEYCRDKKIHIMIDLKGYTQYARTGILANRTAPIQINYLGFPGTMGAKFIDYIIADKIIIPENLKKYYDEKIIYMPDCYQINDGKRSLPIKKFSKHQFGIDEDTFVFCCFNNSYKINPLIFQSWINILINVENSVLLLLNDNVDAKKNLIKEFSKSSIDIKRLIFCERIEMLDHLSRHQIADLFLDTYPYNAHTTCSDALWSGLPILTIIGNSFPSRVCASLLSTSNLNELVCCDINEYEEKAINFGNNKNALIEIKNRLINSKNKNKLFDAKLFTKNIEYAYIKIFNNYVNNSPNYNIYL